eukprot:Skav223278  [mRNA]  locus=scaffold3424:265097:265985:+ [translate_table: standard]
MWVWMPCGAMVFWLRSIQALKDPFADALGGIPPGASGGHGQGAIVAGGWWRMAVDGVVGSMDEGRVMGGK